MVKRSIFFQFLHKTCAFQIQYILRSKISPTHLLYFLSHVFLSFHEQYFPFPLNAFHSVSIYIAHTQHPRPMTTQTMTETNVTSQRYIRKRSKFILHECLCVRVLYSHKSMKHDCICKNVLFCG